MALVPSSWRRTATGYAGSLLPLPDRGYNVGGAADHRARVDTLDEALTPLAPGASGAAQDQFKAKLEAGTAYDGGVPVAPKGMLAQGVVPARLTPFIDLNGKADPTLFGLHNGAPKDRNDVSEKWEGRAAAPALDPARPDDVLLFVANEDFITQRGFQAGQADADASGAEVDTMILVYRVSLPTLAQRAPSRF